MINNIDINNNVGALGSRSTAKIGHIVMSEMINAKGAYLGLTALQKYRHLLTAQPKVAETVPLKDIASYLDITPHR